MSDSNRMKILVAYDGSAYADDAISDLRRAGLPPVAEALVVNVSEVWLPFPAVHRSAKTVAAGSGSADVQTSDSRSDQRAELDETSAKTVEAGESLKSFFPEWDVKTESLRGSPAATITRLAKDWNADLLIAGSRGRSELNRLFFGSVSQKLANEVPSSVRIARSSGIWKNGAPIRMLIGFDGTPAAEAAVAEAAGRFWMIGSEVRLVVVVDKQDPGTLGDTELPGDEAGLHPRVSEFVDRAHRQLSRAELQVSELIEEGDPKQILVAEAEEWGADCIFVGAGGNGNGIKNLLLGSVATAVVGRAHCTVEIVRSRQTGA